jgi:hypothetical protein
MAPLLFSCLAATGPAVAQLPTARLDGLVPRGAQSGHECEVTLQGADLDDVRTLIFSHQGLGATHIEGARFKVSVAADVPAGLHEVRAAGRYGISTGAVFAVGTLPELAEPADNHSRPAAAPVPLAATVNGTADADASDYFKVTAVKGQEVHIDCAAQRIDSPMDAVLSVRDPDGREIVHAVRAFDRDPSARFVPAVDGEHTIEVHDATWRGGPGYLYRLSLSPTPDAAPLPKPVPLAGVFVPPASPTPTAEAEPNDTPASAQPVTGPGEITGHLDRDWFTFTSDAARTLIVEVVSHRDGMASDPVLVIHKVTRDPAGAEQSSQVAEFDDTPGPPGAERFRLGSRDPVGRLTAEAGTTYRLFLTDRFNTGAPFRLLIREPRPDFHVLIMPESPATDAKSLMRWTPFLRRQGSTVLNVAVLRLDGFDEAVTLEAGTLPTGVTMDACPVPPGVSTQLVVLRASTEAPAWSGPLALAGHAAGQSRPAREVAPRWNVGDAGTERIDLRLSSQGPMLAVSEDGGVPLQVEPTGPAVVETSLGATLEIPVKFLRAASHKGFKGEWEAALFGLPGQRAWQPAKPAGDAAEARLALALTKKDGNRFVPGTWTIYAATRGTVQWQPDEKVPVREVRDATFSMPIQVKIDPSPVALSAPETMTLARGGKAALPVMLDRRFGFAEAVTLTLRLPDGLTGVAAPAVTVPKEAAEGSLALEGATDVATGRHTAVIEAKCQWNGEDLVSRRDVILEIQP